MGMDVYGKKPGARVGHYFRNNVWYWHPLADYCRAVAPEVALKCDSWHSNDGDGLDAEDARELAERLREEIANGNCEKYMQKRQEHLDALPEMDCTFCDGGKKPKREKPCTWCKGTGRQKDSRAYYSFDVDNVRQFAAFLEESGGFEIC